MTQNGSQEAIEEERKRREEFKGHQQAQQVAARRGEPLLSSDRDTLEAILESNPDIGDRGDVLRNLLQRDYPLANFSEEMLTEFRWELEVLRDMFFVAHPDERCVITGDFAKYVYDDPEAGTGALTVDEQIKTIQTFRQVLARWTRGEEMAQQEMNAKQIQESRMKRDDGDANGGGIRGRLGL